MMMIQGLNSCSSTTAKTAEIMSRYRPIAPRPDNLSSEQGSDGSGGSSSNAAALPQKLNQSPYLRNVWHSLQARPTRTRKRGRTGFAPPPPTALKRQRATHHPHHLFGFSTPTTPIQIAPKNLTMQCFGHGYPSLLPRLPLPPGGLVTLNTSPLLDKPQETIQTMSTLVTLPLLRSPPLIAPKQPLTVAAAPEPPPTPVMNIDLNRVVVEIPEEKDLLQQLHKPISPTTTTTVISPQAIRLVGSSISVGTIKENPGLPSGSSQQKKEAAEVEEEVEAEPLPAVVSDSKNKVRLANPAYREMVGQPECLWLDSITPCNRICGEVMLRFADNVTMPSHGLGFTCWVTIQWLSNGNSKSVRAFCDVTKLCCDSKDYLYAWRFHAMSEAGGCNA